MIARESQGGHMNAGAWGRSGFMGAEWLMEFINAYITQLGVQEQYRYREQAI